MSFLAAVHKPSRRFQLMDFGRREIAVLEQELAQLLLEGGYARLELLYVHPPPPEQTEDG